MVDFIVGYAAGLITVTGVSGVVGWYMYRHPRKMVRRMMGSKRA